MLVFLIDLHDYYTGKPAGFEKAWTDYKDNASVTVFQQNFL